MAGTLERLALESLTAKLPDRWLTMQVLKDYVRRGPEDKIVRELGLVEDKRVFGKLLGAGLTQREQDAAAKRHKELSG